MRRFTGSSTLICDSKSGLFSWSWLEARQIGPTNGMDRLSLVTIGMGQHAQMANAFWVLD